MIRTPIVVFLFDVDNVLIDNDRVQADLKAYLEQMYGIAARERYWEILEALRDELGYVDYLGALERFRIERAKWNDPAFGKRSRTVSSSTSTKSGSLMTSSASTPQITTC